MKSELQHNNELSEEDKLFWFSYIETKIGLVLPAIQQRRFESRIIERMQQSGLSSDEYFRKVKLDDEEWQSLIDDLTIPETSFFRHQASFDLVESYLKEKRQGSVHIWSVGCSSGEEAWSLAMLADQLTTNFKIMATDVSEMSVQRGQDGVYSARKLEILPTGFAEKYFEPARSSESMANAYRIKDSLRAHVSFYRHNLVDQRRLPFREIDIIFCQNVLIYFRNFVQRDILNQLVNSLSVGGLLVMAPAEARSWKHEDMERVSYPGTLAFRRIK